MPASFHCCANGCTQSRSTNPGPEELEIKFHLFPMSNPVLLKTWITALKKGKLWRPARNTTLCSRHFNESDYKTSGWHQKKLLKRDAVPSRFLYGPECIDLNKDDTDNAILPEPELTEDQLGVLDITSIEDKIEWKDEQSLNVAKIIENERNRRKNRSNSKRKIAENESASGLFEGDTLDKVIKASKRSARIEKIVKTEQDELPLKRLRQSFSADSDMVEDEEDDNRGNIDDNDDDDEEMVIVVVQNEADDNNDDYADDVRGDAEYESSLNDQPASTAYEESVITSDFDGAHPSHVKEKDAGAENEVDVESFCRLCLSKRSGMLPLFETSLRFIKSSLEDIIASCTGVKVLKEDASNKICQTCLSRLESFWVFRELCEKSDKLVRKMKEMRDRHLLRWRGF